MYSLLACVVLTGCGQKDSGTTSSSAGATRDIMQLKYDVARIDDEVHSGEDCLAFAARRAQSSTQQHADNGIAARGRAYFAPSHLIATYTTASLSGNGFREFCATLKYPATIHTIFSEFEQRPSHP